MFALYMGCMPCTASRTWGQPRDSLAWTSGTPVCLIANSPRLAPDRAPPQIAVPDTLSSVQNGSIGNSGRRLDGVGLIEDGSDEIPVGTQAWLQGI